MEDLRPRSGLDVDIRAEPHGSAKLSAPGIVATSPHLLLHITHARQDEAWVQGVLIPALGLAEGQFWTRAEDDLGAVKLAELERAVRDDAGALGAVLSHLSARRLITVGAEAATATVVRTAALAPADA